MIDDARYLRIAAEMAALSRCKRLHVGAVLVSVGGSVLAAAFNGPNGFADCTGAEGACGCAHAEHRARDWSYSERAVYSIYVTHQPCAMCARMMISWGYVQRVRWTHPYRLTEGAELLVAAGIDARRFEP